MPHRPTIEPTDRSMPPVMMTKVMPMARNAFSATCFDMSTKLPAERKLGAAKEKNSSTAKSAMKVLSFITCRHQRATIKVGHRRSSPRCHVLRHAPASKSR